MRRLYGNRCRGKIFFSTRAVVYFIHAYTILAHTAARQWWRRTSWLANDVCTSRETSRAPGLCRRVPDAIIFVYILLPYSFSVPTTARRSAETTADMSCPCDTHAHARLRISIYARINSRRIIYYTWRVVKTYIDLRPRATDYGCRSRVIVTRARAHTHTRTRTHLHDVRIDSVAVDVACTLASYWRGGGEGKEDGQTSGYRFVGILTDGSKMVARGEEGYEGFENGFHESYGYSSFYRVYTGTCGSLIAAPWYIKFSLAFRRNTRHANATASLFKARPPRSFAYDARIQ